jgi:hypothetical protein
MEEIVQDILGDIKSEYGSTWEEITSELHGGFGLDEVRDPEDWDEGNTEPPNNFAVYINGKKWKVFKGRGQFADDYKERDHYRQLQNWAQAKSQSTGKKWEVAVTGENPTESIQAEKFDPLKHVKNPTQGEKDAAKDVKRGSYGDRAAMLKSAEKDGRLKELSTNTLKSYQDKAGKEIVHTMTSGDYMTTDKSAKKVMNRMRGSEKADNKIYKKDNA